jgi:hypothetical protein
LQLSLAEKRDKARFIYNMTPVSERHKLKTELKEILAVADRTLNGWFDRIDRDTRNSQRARCFDLWLACHKQDEIAARVGMERRTISDWEQCFGDFSKLAESAKSAAHHKEDFKPPQKNVWMEHDETPHLDFPGSTEPRWLDNLLYLYTQPFNIVVDPFGGSGSTINLCRKRVRRYWVSDRKPIPERAHEIRLWDMTDGTPPLHNWRDVKLVYLDPPYWKQVEGKYSQDPTDLANMSLEDFTETLWRVINEFRKKLQPGAHIALIIQPTHWFAPEHAYTDHAVDMLQRVKLPVARRIACPRDTPQYTAYLEWCLEKRDMLALNREIIVWRVP